MRIYLEIDVSNCRSCPLRTEDHSHGSIGSYCRHPEAPEGYGNIIEDIYNIPVWCPGGRKKYDRFSTEGKTLL